MAADDEVHALCFLCELEIFFEANVGEGYDPVDALFFFEVVDGVLHGFDGVREDGALVGLGNVGGGLGRDGNEAEAVFGEDVVWDEGLVETGIGGLYVCSYDGKVERLNL